MKEGIIRLRSESLKLHHGWDGLNCVWSSATLTSRQKFVSESANLNTTTLVDSEVKESK